MKRILGILTATVLLGGAGCAGDSSAPPVCDSYAAVQVTVDHIRDTNVSENGLAALRPYLTQLKTELNQLYLDAKAQFAPQADALKAAVDQLTANVRAAQETRTVTDLAAVRTSVSAVRNTAQSLHDTIAATC
jgi:hypothetical protein